MAGRPAGFVLVVLQGLATVGRSKCWWVARDNGWEDSGVGMVRAVHRLWPIEVAFRVMTGVLVGVGML